MYEESNIFYPSVFKTIQNVFFPFKCVFAQSSNIMFNVCLEYFCVNKTEKQTRNYFLFQTTKITIIFNINLNLSNTCLTEYTLCTILKETSFTLYLI